MLTDEEFFKEYGVYPISENELQQERQALLDEFDALHGENYRKGCDRYRNDLSYRIKCKKQLEEKRQILIDAGYSV